MKPKLDMTTHVGRLQGEFYIPNLANRLLYEGFEFGDEVRIRVKLVKRVRKTERRDDNPYRVKS